MKNRKSSMFRLAGACVAFTMGSGFATGQEILQFFTSFGYKSFVIIAIDAVIFWLAARRILQEGKLHENDTAYEPFRHFCGKALGTFYDWLLPVSLFAAMIILVSGSGETLQQNFGINHYVGALLMALLAFGAYLIGFQRFVKTVSFIGPTMIAFILIVGTATIVKNRAELSGVAACMNALSAKQPVPFWWLSALLYGSYNLTGGTKYFSKVGCGGASEGETRRVAGLYATGLILSILIMNTAMLTEPEQTAVIGIPTLYLAQEISPVLGTVFSLILILGIFSSCSGVLWTICEKFVVQGTKKSFLFAAAVSAAAFLGGLLPFSDLISTAYTALGFAGLLYIILVLASYLRKNRPAEIKK